MMAKELHKPIYHQKSIDNKKKRWRYIGDGVSVDENSVWFKYYPDAAEWEEDD